MKVINLFAGPGAGKSTMASGLFYLMKQSGCKVELVTEYAKDLTYEERFQLLSDNQLYVFAKQEQRLRRLKDKVDWVITDSPILLSHIYAEGSRCDTPAFYDFVERTVNLYDNINVLVKRDKPYMGYGRSQTEDEARLLDGKINRLLSDLAEKGEISQHYLLVDGNPKGLNKLYRHIQSMGDLPFPL